MVNKRNIKYVLFFVQAIVTLVLLFVFYGLEIASIMGIALFITVDFVLIALLLVVGVLVIVKTPMQ